MNIKSSVIDLDGIKNSEELCQKKCLEEKRVDKYSPLVTSEKYIIASLEN